MAALKSSIHEIKSLRNYSVLQYMRNDLTLLSLTCYGDINSFWFTSVKQKNIEQKRKECMMSKVCNFIKWHSLFTRQFSNHMSRLLWGSPWGGTQIWKLTYHICTYWRIEVGVIRCKISLKKGGHLVCPPTKEVFFGVDSQKLGSYSVCKKCNLTLKFANLKIKFLNFSKCMQSEQKFII